MSTGAIRQFLAYSAAILAAAIAVPCAAAPPDDGKRLVAVVSVGPEAANRENIAALRAGFAELGHVDGRNLQLVFRWADQRPERLPALVAELALRPAVIMSLGGPVTLRAVRDAKPSPPVVFITGDPVVEGIVASFARPGGNLTGFSVHAEELEPKRLDILRRLLPKARRIAVIWNPSLPHMASRFAEVEEAGARLRFKMEAWPVRDRKELEAVLAGIGRSRPDALHVIADPVLGFERERIVAFAARERLPGMYFWRDFARAGGLASYGTDLAAMYRRSAAYVDRILRGARPADLPIERPTVFEFVINRRTALSLGIDVPPELLALADEVIE